MTPAQGVVDNRQFASTQSLFTVTGGKAPNTQHNNNKVSLRFIVMAVIPILALGYVLFKVLIPPPRAVAVLPTSTPTVTMTATMLPTVARVVPTEYIVPVLPPTLTPLPTNTPTVTPTFTPTATFTPTSTPFPVAFVVNVSAIWPKSSFITASGVDYRTLAGRGAACPSRFPFGSEIVLANGRRFTCIDRGRLQCYDKICQVRVFSQSPVSEFQPAYAVEISR